MPYLRSPFIGVFDVRARWVADRLGPALGHPVVVENRTSAGGNIGMQHFALSAAGGYTLDIVHQGMMAMNSRLHARTGYDALTDFVLITWLGMGPPTLAVGAAAGRGTCQARSRQKPAAPKRTASKCSTKSERFADEAASAQRHAHQQGIDVAQALRPGFKAALLLIGHLVLKTRVRRPRVGSTSRRPAPGTGPRCPAVAAPGPAPTPVALAARSARR